MIPSKKITFLREPVRRILSEHRFWKKCYVEKNQIEKLYKEHFFPAGDPLYTMNNHQTLFLSNFDPRDSSVPIEKHLQSACYNLENNFFFVGVVEELDSAIYQLCDLMHWKRPATIPKLQSTDDVFEVYSKELLEDIAQRNWADIQLYEFAKQLFYRKFLVSKGVLKNKKKNQP